MRDEIINSIADSMMVELKELSRLAGLSNVDLVNECLCDGESCSADDPVVQEMMNRLFPGWEEQPDEPLPPEIEE